MQLLELSLPGRIVCRAACFERAGVFSVWFGCQVLRREAETCFLNVRFVCTGLWDRCQICGEDGVWQPGTWCAVWHPLCLLGGSTGGQLRGSSSKKLGWPMLFIYPVPIGPWAPYNSRMGSAEGRTSFQEGFQVLLWGISEAVKQVFRLMMGHCLQKLISFLLFFFSWGLEVKV